MDLPGISAHAIYRGYLLLVAQWLNGMDHSGIPAHAIYIVQGLSTVDGTSYG